MILLLLAASLAWAAPAGEEVSALLRTMEAEASRPGSLHPLQARKLDAQLASHGPRVRSMGPEAVAPLGAYLADPSRPLKVRLYAAAFLGLIADPGALAPLRARVEDPSEDPELRAAALQAAASLRLGPEFLRSWFDGVADDETAPEVLRREALTQLAWLGSDSPDSMLKAVKRAGPRPKGPAAAGAGYALAALGRSRSQAATGSLLRALRYAREGSVLRTRALQALRARDIPPGSLPREDLELLLEAVLDRDPSCASAASGLLGRIGDRRAVAGLLRSLRSADPSTVASAAEALACIGDPEAAPTLRRLEEGLISDRRFSPSKDRPDTASFARRVQKAARIFASDGAAPSGEEAGFRYRGWPGGGRPELFWTGGTRPLGLRREPSRAEPVSVSVSLEQGRPIALEDSWVLTHQPG